VPTDLLGKHGVTGLIGGNLTLTELLNGIEMASWLMLERSYVLLYS